MNGVTPRAVVCDDDPRVRRVVAGLLSGRGYDVVAEVEVATDAVRVAALAQPDLVVIDVALMGMTGVEAIPAIRAAAPAAFVIVFSAFDAARREAIDAGADLVIDKTAPYELDDAVAGLAANCA